MARGGALSFKWKFEIFKMAIYIYMPIITWYLYNTDFIQNRYIYPRLKIRNPEFYKQLMLEEDEDETPDKTS